MSERQKISPVQFKAFVRFVKEKSKQLDSPRLGFGLWSSLLVHPSIFLCLAQIIQKKTIIIKGHYNACAVEEFELVSWLTLFDPIWPTDRPADQSVRSVMLDR